MAKVRKVINKVSQLVDERMDLAGPVLTNDKHYHRNRRVWAYSHKDFTKGLRPDVTPNYPLMEYGLHMKVFAQITP